MPSLSPFNTGLPSSLAHTEVNEPNDHNLLPDDGSPIILIVENNDIVSEFLQSTFRIYGYRTLVAATKEQAVEHCLRQGTAIHAMVADVMLGRHDGFAIAQMLMEICPKMKAILISGYPYEHLVRVGLLPPDLSMEFLQKPFLPGEIMSVLKSMQHLS